MKESLNSPGDNNPWCGDFKLVRDVARAELLVLGSGDSSWGVFRLLDGATSFLGGFLLLKEIAFCWGLFVLEETATCRGVFDVPGADISC